MFKYDDTVHVNVRCTGVHIVKVKGLGLTYSHITNTLVL